jgi:Kef-type K+ transport system membrane component KefB
LHGLRTQALSPEACRLSPALLLECFTSFQTTRKDRHYTMVTDFISIAVIALVAALSPLIANLIPRKVVPETVFLIIAGAVLGPHMAGLIVLSDSVNLLGDLGLAFLFLLAGYEINTKHLTGTEGKRGFVTWLISLGIAFAIVLMIPQLRNNEIEIIAIAIALTTTALGTLMPIMKERGLMNTRVGNAILSYGTYGELGPIIAMALLLSTRAEWKTVLILLAFIAIAVLAAVFSSRARKAGGKIYHFLDDNANTTSQTAMRFTVLLLVALTALSAIFHLDIIMGAFAAGFILRYVIPEGNSDLEMKLDGIAYGFLIPLFFVVSGAKVDLSAVLARPTVLIGFIVLLLLVRAVPIFVALSTGKSTKDMRVRNRVTVSLYCTTALPIIVAVTTIAVQVGAMSPGTSSVLVSAGAITVLVMPLLASLTHKASDEIEEKESSQN